MLSAEIAAKAARIRVILLDVDGVMTDGKVQIHGDGTESKSFDIKDGIALVWAQRLSLTVGILSARTSASTTQRAAQLGITLVYQGVASKIDTYDQIVGDVCVDDEEVAYMGDDLPDMPLAARAGLAVAVANAAPELKAISHYVTNARGGQGAAREVVELILKAQGRWEEAIPQALA